MGERVTVNEVGLRDGLQNQPRIVPVEGKLAMLDALVAAGVRSFEATSFVSPRAVPQMADASELFGRLPAVTGINYEALVPNMKGYERAIDAGVKTVSLVLGATDTFNRKNLNMSLAETIAVCVAVIERARDDGIKPRAYISCATACPYEGRFSSDVVFELAARMFDAGAHDVIVADSIGAGNPAQISHLFGTLARRYGAERLAGHFHDTRGLGLALTWAALECGIRTFDSSIGGLGGCPFAPGATGNLATEDLVFMLEESGFETGIDMAGLRAAVAVAEAQVGQTLGGRIMTWYRSQEQRQQAKALSA